MKRKRKLFFKKIFATALAAAVLLTTGVFDMPGKMIAVAAEEEGTEPAEEETAESYDCSGNHEEEGMQIWNGDAFTQSGSYYLEDNIELTETIKIGTGVEVTLCLNGKDITMTEENKSIFEVRGGTLTLCDCNTDEPGKLTGVEFTENGQHGGAVKVYKGMFIMNSVTISGNKLHVGKSQNGKDWIRFGGGGVYVGVSGVSSETGTFIMNSGRISDNIVDGEKTNMLGDYRGGGGGVCVRGGTFIMNGGTISQNTVTKNDSGGGGVYVISESGCESDFIMKGGTISQNTVNIEPGGDFRGGGGGVYVGIGGTFTMSGESSIKDNTLDTNGSSYSCRGVGVYVHGGTFTMNGESTITGNKAGETSPSGGGVYLAYDEWRSSSKGSFTMNDNSSITGNEAGNGGGVYVGTNGEFTMNGNSSITGNEAENSGGGVFVSYGAPAGEKYLGGSLIMNEGTITGNKAKDGGGVYLGGWGGNYLGGTLTMNKSTITGNEAENGGGVYVAGAAFKINVNGKVEIKENVKGDKSASNVYIVNINKIITIGSEFDADSSIGVSLHSTYKLESCKDRRSVAEFDSGVTKSDISKSFTADKTGEDISYDEAQGSVMLTGPHLWGEWEATLIPTADKDGEAKRPCKNCDKSESLTFPAINKDSGTTVTLPTLTQDGSVVYTSDEYGKVTVTIPKLSDTGVWTKDPEDSTEPERDKEGKYIYTNKADETLKVEVSIPKLSDPDAWTKEPTKEPTADEEGEYIYTNKDDETIKVKVPVPALSDTDAWTKELTKEPTADEEGEYTYTNKADETIKVKVPVPELSNTDAWTKELTKEPAADEEGEYTYTNKADETIKVKVPVPELGDTEAWTKELTKEPTADEEGEYTYTNKADETIKVKVPVPELSDTEAWTKELTKEPTADEEGEYTYTNKADETLKVKEPVPELSDTEAWTKELTKEPTVDEEGEYTYTNKADETLKVKVPVPELSNTDAWTKELTTEPTVDEKGEYTYTNKADETIKVKVPVPELSDTEAWTKELTKEPTVDEEGEYTYTNKADETLKVKVPVPALSDTEAWTKELTTEPTADGKGEYTYTNKADETIKVKVPVPALSDTEAWTKELTIKSAIDGKGEYTYTNKADETLKVKVEIPELSDTEVWEKTEITRPTISETGTYTYKSKEHDDVTVTVPRLSDTKVWEKTETTKPTISETGTYTYTSAYGTITVTVPKLSDPAWTKTETQKPTVNTGGEYTYTSEIYGDVTIKVPALSDENFWTKDTANSTEPTEDKPGQDVYTSEYGTVIITIPPIGHVHNFSHVDEVPATERETGTKEHWHCEVCGKNFTDETGRTEITDLTIPATGHKHTLTHVPEVPATERETGTKEHWHCEVCGKNFTDETGTNEITNLTIPVIGHEHTLTYVEEVPATETTEGTREHWHCEGCGNNFADENGETEMTKTDLTIPATGHEHTFTYVPEVPATETTPGTKAHWHCEGCGKDFADENGNTEMTENDLIIPVIPVTGHEHTLTYVPEVPATETTEGTREHWHCDGCEKDFADENGETEITADELKIGKIEKEVQSGENAPTAALTTPDEELFNAVLTSEEQKVINDGKDIKIILKIEAQDTATAKDKTAVEKAIADMKDYKLGQYLEINLLKIIGGEQKEVTKTSDPLMITIDIPVNLRGSGRTYSVIRVHNGETTILPDLDNNENTVTIKTDKFSTYTLVFKDMSSGVNDANGNNDNQEDDDADSSNDTNASDNGVQAKSPKTGEINTVYGWLLLAMISAIGALAAEEKLRSSKKRTK